MYIRRVLVEVIDGSPVERLSFTSSVPPSGASGSFEEGSGSDSASLLEPSMNSSSVIYNSISLHRSLYNHVPTTTDTLSAPCII